MSDDLLQSLNARVGALSTALGEAVRELDAAKDQLREAQEGLDTANDALDLLFEINANLTSVLCGFGALHHSEITRSCEIGASKAKESDRLETQHLLNLLRRFLNGNRTGSEFVGLNWERALADGRECLR